MTYLSTREAAARWGLTPRRVRHLARTGGLPARRLGRLWAIIDDAQQEAFCADCFAVLDHAASCPRRQP